MKKIFLCILLCLCLTGCSINYNLEIDNNSFKETITGDVLNEEIEINDNQTDISMAYQLIKFDQPATNISDDLLYNKVLTERENSTYYNYSFTYNEQTIKNSKILLECFEDFKFEIDDDYYYLMSIGDFYCNYADEILVNITTDNKVTLNNANIVNGNTYTWIMKEGSNPNINMVVSKSDKVSNKKNGFNTFKIISFVILIILSTAAYMMFKKINNNDY